MRKATVQFDVNTEENADFLCGLVEHALHHGLKGLVYKHMNLVSPVRVSIEADDSQHFEAGQMVPLVEGAGESRGTVTVAKVDRSDGSAYTMLLHENERQIADNAQMYRLAVKCDAIRPPKRLLCARCLKAAVNAHCLSFGYLGNCKCECCYHRFDPSKEERSAVLMSDSALLELRKKVLG
jgi:hypothetical protein